MCSSAFCSYISKWRKKILALAPQDKDEHVCVETSALLAALVMFHFFTLPEAEII